ncbi:TPA: hypothetical protein DEB00_00920 [Candidatus Uhrbacteria bacterium]|nr:hypothetical protein [Candidatus Uhrbacteria bacterium]
MIAIDGVPAAKPKKTGVEWYVYELLKAMNQLQPELDVCVYTHRSLDFVLKGNWKNVVIAWPWVGWKWVWSLYLWATKPQIVFSPGDALPPYVPAKSVQTMHDLAFHWHPELFSQKRARQLERDYKRATQIATKLLAVAQQTKQDVIQAYAIDAKRITVTPLAFDHRVYNVRAVDSIEAMRTEYGLPQTYMVCVGRLDARKGQADLIRSFLLWRGDCEIDLVLIGGPGGDGYEEIHQLTQDPHIHELGWIPSEESAAIMAGACAFVFATKKEGFGIPLLEAMAVGLPVVCSDLPALREVGGDVPFYVDREDVAQWQRAFDRIMTESSDARIARGIQRASHYTWEETAQKTLRVLCSISSNNSN